MSPYTQTEIDSDFAQQAASTFAQGNYAQAIELYEQAIEAAPDEASLYWHLGIALLLEGKEDEAQMVWMTPILEVDSDEQRQQWISELVNLIQSEAERQEIRSAHENAWLLRQHIREWKPDDWENGLETVWLALKAHIFSVEDEVFAQIVTHLGETELTVNEKQRDRLLQISEMLLTLDPGHPATLNFLEVCISHLQSSETWTPFLHLLLDKAGEYYKSSINEIAAQLGSLCARLAPNDMHILFKVLNFLQHGGVKYLLESITVAERCIELSQNSVERILALHSLLASWIYSGGHWQRATEIYEIYKVEISHFLSSQPEQVDLVENQNLAAEVQLHTEPVSNQGFIPGLITIGSLPFYFEDNPKVNRPVRNQLAQAAQTHLQAILRDDVQQYQQHIRKSITGAGRRLPKIGYFAGTLRQHSVGWLSRWLLKYHDRDRFDIRLYCTRKSDDFVQSSLIKDYGDRFQIISSTVRDIANRIADDEIDILVDLDSLSSFDSCSLVALKPAPIQVHWLGYDSSGIPGVDYFIVDPYVLPDDAQDYYSEHLWRLPHTFIGVDGFEVHTPSLRREQLDIPNDAIVYLSCQTGMKRNSDHARLQLRILQEVPNSYFLIKSYLSNLEFVETQFKQLAEEEGVSVDRLRFLPDESSEFIHRANLRLADIILDTYPYSGATTTLEALWMGLPIITHVGEQFASRNSYSMMMNVGVTEGIAWSDEEYLEWGIRLGTDLALRQDIFCRLQQSHRTSPLWNGKQFARDMENAFEQMWQQLQ